MIEQAYLLATIPFTVENTNPFGDAFMQNAAGEGWRKDQEQGNFLLKHINTTLAKNTVCFTKTCDNFSLTVPVADFQSATKTHYYPITVSQVQVHCFDTGIGLFTFYIPCCQDTNEDAITNIASMLHNSVLHADSKKGKPVMQDETQTYLSCLAEQFLDRLLGQTYTLFGTSQDTGLHRINMFCVALCDQSNSTEANKLLCYRLSNAYDTRDAQDCPECYYQHPYIRWGFSKRGCAVVANLTGTPTTDEFLLNDWLTSVLTNYFYLFLMVLHQKNATYHYLNQIADDPDGSELLLNQKTLLAFNSKYIFSVISDEAFIQAVFLQLKQAFQADDVYKELQSQLKQMFDYTQLKESEANERKNNRLNLISVIVTVLCSVSIIFDTIGLLASFGYALGFDSVRNIVCTGVIIFEGILFFVLFLFVAFANKKSK